MAAIANALQCWPRSMPRAAERTRTEEPALSHPRLGDDFSEHESASDGGGQAGRVRLRHAIPVAIRRAFE